MPTLADEKKNSFLPFSSNRDTETRVYAAVIRRRVKILNCQARLWFEIKFLSTCDRCIPSSFVLAACLAHPPTLRDLFSHRNLFPATSQLIPTPSRLVFPPLPSCDYRNNFSRNYWLTFASSRSFSANSFPFPHRTLSNRRFSDLRRTPFAFGFRIGQRPAFWSLSNSQWLTYGVESPKFTVSESVTGGIVIIDC